MLIRRKVLVKGIVQGVSFRKQTARVAHELNIRGWVRNRGNGNVEASFTGDAAAVNAIIAWCFVGPERAHVEKVVIRRTPNRGRVDDFRIREDK